MKIDRTIKYGLAGVLVGFLLRGNVKIGSSINGPSRSQKNIDKIWNSLHSDFKGIASESWGKDAGKKTMIWYDSKSGTVLGLIEKAPTEIFNRYLNQAK